MRKFLLPILLCFASNAAAQSVSLTGTVTDTPDNQTWNNGTISFTFFGPQGTSYRWTGGTLNPNTPITATLSGTGTYSVSVPDNSQITPTDSSWNIKVCPAVLPAVSSCFFINRTITSASTVLNLTPPSPRFTVPTTPQAGIPPISAYADSEIVGGWVGFSYYNLPGNSPRNCTAVSGNTCTWASSGINSQNGPGPVFNVKGYGAVGDANYIADGSTTVTVNTVTSVTAHFQTNAKVGQNIVCAASGNSTPIMAITPITAVTSDTVVTTTASAAGTSSNLRCIWYTQDDASKFVAAQNAALAAGAQNSVGLGPVLGTPSGTVYCPAGGYAVGSRIFNFIGSGSSLATAFIGEGRNKCILYMIPGITDPNDGFAVLMSSYNSSNSVMSGFSVEGLQFGTSFSHPIVQFNADTGFKMEDVSIFDVATTGNRGTMDFLGSSSGVVSNVLVQGGNGTSTDFACGFNGTNGVVFRTLTCSNHNQNGFFTGNGIRSVFGDNVPTFFNSIFDECGSSSADCYVFQTNGGAQFFGGWIGVGSSGRSAMNIDGTSQVWLANVNCGQYGNVANNANCATIASGGFLEATGSTLRSNGASGLIVSGPAGATFVDAGGNKYINCVSGTCLPITAANYGTVGFGGGIVPKATVTHTPNTCYAVTGNLLATAQNICTFLNDQNYQVLNITAQSGGTTPTNSCCTVAPVITLSDGTRTATLTMTTGKTQWSSAVDASTVNSVFASGTTLTISIGANTCATPPVNVSVSYVLQSVLNP